MFLNRHQTKLNITCRKYLMHIRNIVLPRILCKSDANSILFRPLILEFTQKVINHMIDMTPES